MSKIKVLFFGNLRKINKDGIYEFNFEEVEINLKKFLKKIQQIFPELKSSKFVVAINQNISNEDSHIKDGDEIALLPPISGGNYKFLIKEEITKEFISRITDSSNNNCGSILTFEGVVRADANNKGSVESIEYSAYDEMAEKEINKIVNKSCENFGLIDVIVKHRLGKVKLNEIAFFVAVFSAHRKEGIKAIDFIIDEVKKIVPIWKEEFYTDGSKVFKDGQLISTSI